MSFTVLERVIVANVGSSARQRHDSSANNPLGRGSGPLLAEQLNGFAQALCCSTDCVMRSERLLWRLRRFINAMDATSVRSSSARTLFVSGESEWFFRSNFISSLFRMSLVLQARVADARDRNKALQCGCNVAGLHKHIIATIYPPRDAMTILRFTKKAAGIRDPDGSHRALL